MWVKVKLYGHLPDLAGKNEMAIEVQKPTVRGLVEAMNKTCPQALMSALVDFQSDPPELLVMAAVDNVATFYSEGIDSPLKEGSEVTLMPALAGGHEDSRLKIQD